MIIATTHPLDTLIVEQHFSIRPLRVLDMAAPPFNDWGKTPLQV
jgi:hypothetical protein